MRWIKAFVPFFLTLGLMSIILMLEEEEEEEEGADYSVNQDIPSDAQALSDWWEKFKTKAKFPFYGLLLALDSDSEATSALVKHHQDLARFSGSDCCFIYFRDLERAKALKPFDYTEYLPWVNSISYLNNINITEMPCLLFFEDIRSEELVRIGLKDLSQKDILELVQQIFIFIRNNPNNPPYLSLKKFHRSHIVKKKFASVFKNLFIFKNTSIYDILKSIIPIPLP